MRRIKVVSEPTDLVPILRAFDSDVKRDVFRKLGAGWITVADVEREFGPDGAEAMNFFEKTKLVETKWEIIEGKTAKAYHSYYTAFQVNISCAAQDISEILAVAAMPEPKFRRVEEEIEAMVGDEGFSARAITEKLNIPLTQLKSLLKRSSRLEFRGHLVKKLNG